MRAIAGLQRKRVTLVLQQHHGFPCRAQRELPMLGRIDLARGNPSIGKTGRRVEHAELESRPEEAAQRVVEIGFLDQALMNRVNERWERLPVLYPHSRSVPAFTAAAAAWAMSGA